MSSTNLLSSSAPHFRHESLADDELDNWGPIPTMVDGESTTSGKLLYKGDGNHPEAGLWVCTPGTWQCHVTEDEFCHFLEGQCTYTHESGEVIEITPGVSAFFPKDWQGICHVRKTIRKVYMIR